MGNSNAGEERLGTAASEVKRAEEEVPAAQTQGRVNATQKDVGPTGRTTTSLRERLKPVLTASFIALPVAHIITSALFFIAPGSIATIISGISAVVLTAAYIVADSTYKFSDYSAIPLVRKGFKLVDKLIINKVIPPAIWIGAFGYAAYFLFQWSSVNSIYTEMDTFWKVAHVVAGSFVAVGIGALIAGWVGIFVKAIPEIIIDFLPWRVRNMLEKREEGRRYNAMPQDSLSKLTKRQAFYIASIGSPAIEEFFHRFIVVNSWMYIGSDIFGLNYPLSIIVTLVVGGHYFWATHRPNQYAEHLSSGLGYSALYLAASYFVGPFIGFIVPLAAHFTHNTWMMSSPEDSIFDRDASSGKTQAPLTSDTKHFLSTTNSETGQKVNMVVQEAAGLFDANTPSQCVDATRWIAAKLDNLDIKNQERTINIPFDASKEVEVGDPTTSHIILEAIFDDTIWVIDTQLMQFTLSERNKLKLPEKFVFQYVYQASDYYAKVPVFSDSVCAERIDSATISLASNGAAGEKRKHKEMILLASITVKMILNGEPVAQNEMKQVMDKPLYADLGPCICLINGDRMFHVNNEVYLQYNEGIMSRIRNSFDFTKTTYIFDNYRVIKQVDNAGTSAINKALSDIPNSILWERNNKTLRKVVLYPNLEFKVYDEDIFTNLLIEMKRGTRSAI